MDARIAKLEAAAEYTQRDMADIKETLRRHDDKFDGLRERMERDFRLLFAALIAVALGLAGLLGKGFGWL